MTTIILIALAVLSALVTCALLAAAGLAYWVALGEPDVNGDPERDAGLESTAEGRWVTNARHLSFGRRSIRNCDKEGLSSAAISGSANRAVGRERKTGLMLGFSPTKKTSGRTFSHTLNQL